MINPAEFELNYKPEKSTVLDDATVWFQADCVLDYKPTMRL